MLRKIAVLALISASVTVVGVTTATERALAAPVTLSEISASPLVANFAGWDMGFATNSLFSSAAVGDVTGDGQPDVVVGGMNSVARVYDLAVSRVIALDPGGANAATGQGATQPSPALGDINGDGVDDVVIGNTGGRLAAYSVRNGVATQLYNHFVAPAFDGALVGLLGTPAVGYIDRDTNLDVVSSSWGQTVDVWSGPTGQPIPQLRQWLRDTIWSSPVIGDISGDGVSEIVVGADCEGSGTPQPCHGIGQGGYVWAFNLDGSVRWSYFVRDAVVWSTPALIDLNNDGARDVVVGTGLYFLGPAANRIMAIDGRTGQLMWNAATGGPVLGSPAVGLVNGHPRVWIVSGGGMLMSWNAAGQLQWQQCVMDQPCSPGAGTFGGVAIADVNNDGTLDAVVQAEQTLRVLNAVTGSSQTSVRSRYQHGLLPSFATPTVASVNGKTWIVQVNIGDPNGNWQADGGDDLVVSIWTTGTALGAAPWPTFKGNMARTGGPESVPPPQPVVPSGRACFKVSG
ncbi:MAG TPA: PQQ-binding-like beta-propeller repeat protein, partial [Ilumatobacter sp.]|nr:PQQ-binding-like beta-propeller repeat protein [Ilumatobacter sp.]